MTSLNLEPEEMFKIGGIRHYLLKITGAVNKHLFSKARSPYSWGFSPPGFCDQEHYDKGNLDMQAIGVCRLVSSRIHLSSGLELLRLLATK